MSSVTAELLDISCDESGSEGENVIAASHRVFVHASVDLDMAEATAVLDEVRRLAPSQAAEYKADQILRPSAAPAASWLLSAGGPLANRASAYLVDKDYFAVGKVIDLLFEEVAHAAGHDLYAGGQARDLALALHRDGPRALGNQWPPLLAAFNSLMRAAQRKGAKTTVDQFFAALDQARFGSRRRHVERILHVLWLARPHAVEFQQRLVDDPDQPPALDPLFAALPQTARAWHARARRPIRIVHDTQAALTSPRIQAIIDELASPHPEFRRFAPPVRIVAIDQVDSKNDPRVQVADLLAGLARRIATGALARTDDSRARLMRPFVDADSLWSDDASWTVLTGRPGVGA
jgi:hypothetical protein